MERQYLLKPDRPDPKDYKYASYSSQEIKPIDLRPYDFPEILDQGYLGSCTAFAISALKQFKERNESQINAYFYLSQLYLYYKEREIEGTIDFDSGASIRDGLKVLQQVGCCTTSYFPYVESNYKNKPSIEADENAKEHKINSYSRLFTALQLKQALSEKNPVVMGVEIFQSFESFEVASTGVVPFPDRNKEYSLGYHAVLAMGWKIINGEEYIICRNSWSKQWGDKGYFYLPMSYIGRLVSDMWVTN
ncbi:hypothetical protein BC351_10655 [Paenibacillus ferrarius]|uniref:Peptidase C1A papain C-terminal domain-containing protein n=1 Tax=Paenibacillus ferrarius TaxID=1469647 RepID=A0A1V4H910_9BACL|nr:C1 family peptidase [Paenibacillus ferrarius]OPH47641.1 hypothetical protein BC351_10655 [Paenibacillus ferrarius]